MTRVIASRTNTPNVRPIPAAMGSAEFCVGKAESYTMCPIGPWISALIAVTISFSVPVPSGATSSIESVMYWVIVCEKVASAVPGAPLIIESVCMVMRYFRTSPLIHR